MHYMNATEREPWALGFGLTVMALLAFAANSILCRLALGGGAIDAYSFTAIRLGSGALILLLLGSVRPRSGRPARGDWLGTFFLLMYAVPFSLAYVRLDTGTGALLLFGAVQLTMIGHQLRAGQRPRLLEWFGLIGAAGGVVYLVSPGVAAPDGLGAVLMVLAGMGWGGYSITGKTTPEPALATAGNFRRAAILVLPATLSLWPWLVVSSKGVWLAVGSGAIASGLGYTLWYWALDYMTLTRAALVQLAVSVIAAAGGVFLFGESVSLGLALASGVILGSIAVGVLGRDRGVV